ncbi:AAA family ATPase [Clostridium sp.]|uniref:AAA family ATPase n=1 Tax=Clostridium sp. TaxID=1506 RepID=UPI0032165D1F
MAVYLNTNRPMQNYNGLYRSKYFVDKSLIIERLNEVIGTSDKYICITRPRRFGKSSVVDMLGAYYSKAVDSKDVFNTLKISNKDTYTENINKYNVISVSFADVDNNCKSCSEYIDRIANLLTADLKEVFPNIKIKENYAIWDILSELDEKFIFILDEWDYIFNSNLFKEEQNKFLEFLMKLLKDKPYVALCYMTGILPIKKYSSTSALNMFDEFTFLKDRIFGEYFGFTDEEIIELCKKNRDIKFEELEKWYNGYLTAKGLRIYNPRSVVKALQNGYCESYWTNTGSMTEVKEYLKYNTLEIREDVIEMVSGGIIDITVKEEFRAGQEAPKTKEEIYSAMIILGFLSYYDGYLKIPNKELMTEFENALKDESFGYVSEIIENSRKMLKSTVNEDCETVIENNIQDSPLG